MLRPYYADPKIGVNPGAEAPPFSAISIMLDITDGA